MVVSTLAGFGLAIAILIGLAAFIWLETKLTRLPLTYRVSPRGIRVLLFDRLLYHEVRREKIVGVRLQESPGGYWPDSLKIMSVMSRPMAHEGVVVICKDGWEVAITPESPLDFLRAAEDAGISVVPDRSSIQPVGGHSPTPTSGAHAERRPTSEPSG